MQSNIDTSTGQSSGGAGMRGTPGMSEDAGRSSRSTSRGAGSGPAVADRAKEAISDVAGTAASGINSGKTKAAEGLGTVAQALRQTGDQLRDKDQPVAVHQYLQSAADQVERLSGYLRNTSVSQMIGGAEQFARRQPALFLGGAFMLGLLGARFLKSSSPQNSQRPEYWAGGGSVVGGDNYGSGGSGSSARYSGSDDLTSSDYGNRASGASARGVEDY